MADPTPDTLRNVPNYLVQAILATICCCLPFGIVGIVFAAQVNGKLAAGDYAGAMQSSSMAKTWCWVSFGVGILQNLVVLAYFAFVFAAVSAAAQHGAPMHMQVR